MFVFKYFAALSKGKMVLWCYLCWYMVTVYLCFDPSPAIWLNSVGISAVIGTALMLSVANPAGVKPDRWQTRRLYMMPFCVSSFSALIKGHGYILVFPSNLNQLTLSVAACVGFLAFVAATKMLVPLRPQ
ncbi:MAG: hypothetical protein JO269_01515 [Burkholderiaceae bacterium]|nr:hypothetical protein [Burkholderiaceae bacterium]